LDVRIVQRFDRNDAPAIAGEAEYLSELAGVGSDIDDDVDVGLAEEAPSSRIELGKAGMETAGTAS
jgi:hypothetical protein